MAELPLGPRPPFFESLFSFMMSAPVDKKPANTSFGDVLQQVYPVYRQVGHTWSAWPRSAHAGSAVGFLRAQYSARFVSCLSDVAAFGHLSTFSAIECRCSVGALNINPLVTHVIVVVMFFKGTQRVQLCAALSYAV